MTRTSDLNEIYSFMSRAYEGNWQNRWNQTPYFIKATSQGKNESILAHQWSCLGFWFHLRRACPALNNTVDPLEMYERLWSHDLGETFTGDVSLYLQTQGHGADKHVIEKKEIEKLSSHLPSEVQRELITWFEEFEEPTEKINKIEPLLAKYIDAIQGNHFALTYGDNLPSYSELINKIVNRKFMPIAKRLFSFLNEQDKHDAAYEIQDVTHHHLEKIKEKGITLDTEQLS